MDRISVHQIHAGDGDGADIIFDLNDRQIAVSVFPGSSIQPTDQFHQEQTFLEDRLIGLLGRATASEDEEEYKTIVDDVLTVILEAGKSVFAEVAPSNKPSTPSPNQDLHSLLYPGTLTFRLEVTDNRATIVPIDGSQAYTCLQTTFDHTIEGELSFDTNFPHYSPKDIFVLKTLVLGAGYTVCRVQVNGKEMLCKAHDKGLFDSCLRKELGDLQSIRKSHLSRGVPEFIPQLLGYVKDPRTGRIIGLLREWVEGCCLGGIDITMKSTMTRHKWVSQIRRTVNQLHKIGVIWGDGKANNVIIDIENNAWLIDFGGGFTKGWVDEEFANTIEGDKQAIMKIVQLLNQPEDMTES
ncbi:hypothetical protein PG984_012841 [Apiospora sp. TS-2023a]